MSRLPDRRGGTRDGGARKGQGGAVATIDVAHPPMSSEEAESALDELLRDSTRSGGVRIIRVIHGYGSGGKGGTLRVAVRNWAYRRREKIREVIPGEEYSPFDRRIGEVLGAAGVSLAEIGPSDPGVTLLVLP